MTDGVQSLEASVPWRHVASGLGGTGLITDDLYVLSHDERSGRPLLGLRPLGIGLAGALLTELTLGGSIGLDRGGVIVPRRRRPADDLGYRLQAQIAGEDAPRPVRDWLMYLARNAAEHVAGRLELAGYLQPVRCFIPGRKGRWTPVDPNWAFAQVIRVRSALDPSLPIDPRQAALAGLVSACGLGYRISQSGATGDRSVEEAVSFLVPELRHLVSQTQAAIDSAVLSQRT